MTNLKHPEDRLIWIDLEMTGLNPDLDSILEIAIIVTDQKLNIIADDLDLIIHQPFEKLMLMNDFVKNMHLQNGLIDLSITSKITTEIAEQKALSFLEKHVQPKTSPMCGNSICLDRRFLFKHMSKLEEYFHYRNLDVSTVKNLGFYWFPEKIKNFKKTNNNHRAKEDILQSIEELKFYQQNIFIDK